MEQIQAETLYDIIWETPPGDAEMDEMGHMDNGNVEMGLSGYLNGRSCKVFFEDWDIDPIPADEEYTYTKPYEYCRPPFSSFLPFISS